MAVDGIDSSGGGLDVAGTVTAVGAVVTGTEAGASVLAFLAGWAAGVLSLQRNRQTQVEVWVWTETAKPTRDTQIQTGKELGNSF